MVRIAWPKLAIDYKKTNRLLESLSPSVEKQIAIMRTSQIQQKSKSPYLVNKVSKGVVGYRSQPQAGAGKLQKPCFHVPFALDKHHVQRKDIVGDITKTLDPTSSPSLRSLAIYGIGGVGKTQIALQYVYHVRSKFDAVLWISADNQLKMAQDFISIAQHLQIVPNDGSAIDPVSAMMNTKYWLADTRESYHPRLLTRLSVS